MVTMAHIIRGGRRCPLCSKSHGEKHIASWLNEQNILFEQEVRFKDCRSILPLPFDFKIYRNDGSFFLIEYDGSQHYGDGFFEKFEDRKLKDKIKNDYCECSNITLYRIPYTLYDRPGQGNRRINAKLKEICCDCK